MTDRLISAVVFLKGGGKVHLAEPDTSTVMANVESGEPIVGVNTKGAHVALKAEAVLSAVGPEPGYPSADKVVVPSSIFDGRHVKITSAANVIRAAQATPEGQDWLEHTSTNEGVIADMVKQEDAGDTVVVLAEDMAESLVLIMDLRRADDDLVWINPAADPVAIDLTVKAVRALAEAEQREVLFNDPANDPSVTAPGFVDVEGRRANRPRFDGAVHEINVGDPVFMGSGPHSGRVGYVLSVGDGNDEGNAPLKVVPVEGGEPLDVESHDTGLADKTDITEYLIGVSA